MPTELPANRIKKIKLPNNTEYTIVPEILQNNGFQATLPTLTADDVLITAGTDQTITGTKTFSFAIFSNGIKCGNINDMSTGNGIAHFGYNDNDGAELIADGHFIAYGDSDNNNTLKPTDEVEFGDLDTYFFNTGITLHDSDGVDSDVKLSFPGTSGTFALTSDLNSYLPLSAGSSKALTGDLYLGNSSASKAIYIYDVQNSGYAVIREGDNNWSFTDADGNWFGIDTSAKELYAKGNSDSNTYSYSLPNASGTLSVVTASTTGTATTEAKYITINGTEWKLGGSVNDVRVNNVSVLSSGIANIPLATATVVGVVSTDTQTFNGSKTFMISDDTPIISKTDTTDSSYFKVSDMNDNVKARFYASAITSARQFTLPDKDGIFALTNDIPQVIDLRS